MPRRRGARGGGGGTLVAPVTSRFPRAPRTHRRASAEAGVRPPSVRHQPLGIRRAWRPPLAAARCQAFCPRALWVSGVLEPAAVFTGGSRSRRRSRPASGGLGLGSSRARPPPRSILSEPPLGLDWAPGAQRSVAPEPSGLGPFSFGKKQKVLRPGGQPPVLGIAVGQTLRCESGALGQFSTSGCGTKLEITGLDPHLK